MEGIIARLEQATEGSDELDVLIARRMCGYGPTDPMWHALPYTTSLDAAKTLVPDHLGWIVDELGNAAVIYRHTLRRWDARHPGKPALALCIAALRARATPTTGPEKGRT